MRLSKLMILFSALLALPLFVPAAGAIYIPGQEIPNDGLPHIMLADADTGVSSTGVTGAGVAGSGVVSTEGKAVWSGVPTLISPILSPNSGTSTHMGGGAAPSYSGIPMSAFSVPSFNGDVIYNGVIGHAVEPAPPGYWDNPNSMEIHTNMPTLNVPWICG